MAKLNPITVPLHVIIPKITLIWANDWEALYIDGVKKCEGHSVSHHDVFTALGLSCDSKEIATDEDDDCFFEDKLEDVMLKEGVS